MAKRRSTTEKKNTSQTTQPDKVSGSDFPLGTETAAANNHDQDRMKNLTTPGPTPMSEVEFNARVARKAFELFERRGGDSGHDVEDWLEAERMVRDDILNEHQS